jgi:hypothetical protein
MTNNETTQRESGMYRQGDVLIKPISGMPDGLKLVPLDRGRVVLAYGEVTGHAHAVVGEVELLASDLEEMEQRFLRVEAEAQVVHEEHGTITLPPGDYEVLGQREYTSADMEPIRVAD